MPRARRRERLLMLGWLAPEVIGAQTNVVEHQRVNAMLASPGQPVTVRRLEVNVGHAVDQRRRHWLDDGAILAAVARADHNRASRQCIFADAPLMDQAVKRLLHLM